MPSSSLISIACTVVPFLYGMVKSRLAKKQTTALDELKDRAPHILRPPQSPEQLASAKRMARNVKIIGIFIAIIMIGITVVSAIFPEEMKWSLFFDTQTYPDTWQTIRLIGLGWIAASGLVLYRCSKDYLARINYLSHYWNRNTPYNQTDPTSTSSFFILYSNRNDDMDLDSLRHGIYFFVRDPETLAFRWFAIGLTLSSCSWLSLIIFGIIIVLFEPTVVKRDMTWELLYGPIYDTYRGGRGGQISCTCLNEPEAKLEERIRNKQATLAGTTTRTTRAYASTHSQSTTSRHEPQIIQQQQQHHPVLDAYNAMEV